MAHRADGLNDIFEHDVTIRDCLFVQGCTQTKSLLLTDTVWDDLRVPAQNTKLNPVNSEPAFESFIGGTFVYKFSNANGDDESVHFIAQIPHSYKEGTDLYPHIHWAPDTADAGRVAWSFEYTVVNSGEAFGATTTDLKDVSTQAEQHKHILNSFEPIDGTGLKISNILVCRLTRKTSELTDTYTGNACFLEFDFHFEKDTIGSDQELVK